MADSPCKATETSAYTSDTAETIEQFYKHMVSLNFYPTSLWKVINHSILLMRNLSPKEMD